MRFDAFISGTYESESVVADCQRTINLYPEIIESGSGRSRAALRRTPGLALFATMGDGPVRDIIEVQGRTFAIGGSLFQEISSAGVVTSRGVVSSSGTAKMVASPTQVMICAGNVLHCFTLATNAFTTVATPLAEWVAYCDTYFLAIEPGSQKLYMSNTLDGTTWDPADVVSAEAASDNVRQIVADHREVWLFGERTIRPYYNSGSASIFDPIPGSLIEQGMIGHTAAKADNTIIWVGQDARGNGVVWRAEGYRPVRISNHSVETYLQGLSDLEDATAWTYQDQGHLFYELCVPSADRNWVYDVSTNQWHERSYWNSISGVYERHLAQCHAFAFGKHLVGSYAGRQIYEQSISYYDDAGDVMRWLRRSPHLANENKPVFYSSLELVMDTGVPSSTDPQVMMRMSNDGGRNWGSEIWQTSYGKTGETTRRVKWNRLGSSRDRVFEVCGTDACKLTIVDALLELIPGN